MNISVYHHIFVTGFEPIDLIYGVYVYIYNKMWVVESNSNSKTKNTNTIQFNFNDEVNCIVSRFSK